MFTPGMPYQSVEPQPDGRVTFRICAPDATTVSVTSSDNAEVIPIGMGGPAGLSMTKGETGIWSVTTAKPVAAGTYRFNFSVNGARVPDPMDTHFSEERTGINSVFEMKGAEGDFQTWKKDVAHGTVSIIEYWSNSIGEKRRAHIYTPPGYMTNTTKYPVLYLLHGGGDSDDSWTSVGHAQYILDNLMAAGKAKPMIMVMPFAHTPDRPGINLLNDTNFTKDFFEDLIPDVERSFRVIPDADHRAMAGLSMGGMHTLRNGITHPEMFHYVGIFSIGLGFSVGPGGIQNDNGKEVSAYTAQNDAALKRGAKEFKLVYYAIGKDDFLYQAAVNMRGALDQYGIRYVYHESSGGHTWTNWRGYLEDLLPRLFN